MVHRLILWRLAVVTALRCQAEDSFAGVGGFVHPHADLPARHQLNLSVVKVSLTTLKGKTKESIECMPNGAFFIPVYQQGRYTVQVVEPAGWSFEPAQPEVEVRDQEIEVNFHLVGFRVVGAVSAQQNCIQDASLAGGRIKAINADTGREHQAVTDADGSYEFAAVPPGHYTIHATHERWFFSPAETTTVVRHDNVVIDSSFVVAGIATATGMMLWPDGEPVELVEIYLYREILDESFISALNCSAPDVAGPLPGRRSLCKATTDAMGAFTFASLPCGTYRVVPAHYNASTKAPIHVTPMDAVLTISSRTTRLPSFRAIAFTIRGRVIHRGGLPQSGVAVFVDGGAMAAQTVADGTYELLATTTGQHNVSFYTDRFQIDTLDRVEFVSGKPLPVSVVSKYRVCGTVQVGEGQRAGWAVALKTENTENVDARTKTDKNGNFCLWAQTGKYRVTAAAPKVLAGVLSTLGVIISPKFHTITVGGRPVENLLFSHSRATVSGKVECLGVLVMGSPGCDPGVPLTATLHPATQASSVNYSRDRRVKVVAGVSFRFGDVRPGKYFVRIGQGEDHSHYCWEHDEHVVEVGAHDVTNVTFRQIAFAVSVLASFECSLSFALQDNNTMTPTTVDVPRRGRSRICALPMAGAYEVVARSCNRFETETYTYDTRNPKELILRVAYYKVVGKVLAITRPSDLTLSVVTAAGNCSGCREQLNTTWNAEDNAAEYEYWSPTLVELIVEPSSPSLVFYPHPGSRKVLLADTSCPQTVPIIQAREGAIIHGIISPAVESVTVNIVDSSGHMAARGVSDIDGSYVAGPVYSDVNYTIEASKPGYSFIQSEKSNFNATLLSRITGHVTLASSQAVGGVLLSLAGHDTDGVPVRQKKRTDGQGRFIFSDINHGAYHLKPQMKEYTFHPPHRVRIKPTAACVRLSLHY
jgi:hypothetical protein